MNKKCIAVLLIFLTSTIPSFAMNNSIGNVEQVEVAENTLDLENYLNTYYKEKTFEGKTLEFKYELREFEDYLRVKMKGQDFHKDSSKLNNEDIYFQKLIETLVQEINKSSEKKISFYIYDKNNNVVAKYRYSTRKSIVEKIHNDLKDYNVNDLENDLDSTYAKYIKDGRELEFEYESKNSSNYIMVIMVGQNFSHYDSSWKNRDIHDFRNFLKGMSEEISEEFGKDVYIKIYSESGKNRMLARYEYNENIGDFTAIIEDEKDIKVEEMESIDDSQDQKVLDDGTYIYSKGRYDLRFGISTKKSKDAITIEFKGKNFDKDSCQWADRDKDDFESFLKGAVNGLLEEPFKYVNIIIYDEEKEIAGKYYVEKNELNTEFEEGFDQGDLNYYYGKYTDENTSLEFQYRFNKDSIDDSVDTSQYLKIGMYCQNFHSDKWKEKNDKKFEEFLESIAEEVSREYNSNVVITTYNGSRKIKRYSYIEETSN
ncbi:hypothetical protein R9X47_00395 [Wukongibacter baidiensis]|uniref:hypothetical protein n=1 Tax=Wukongibacter baidiensis TaxID=1723361 RepID=UPI003D7F5B3F